MAGWQATAVGRWWGCGSAAAVARKGRWVGASTPDKQWLANEETREARHAKTLPSWLAELGTGKPSRCFLDKSLGRMQMTREIVVLEAIGAMRA